MSGEFFVAACSHRDEGTGTTAGTPKRGWRVRAGGRGTVRDAMAELYAGTLTFEDGGTVPIDLEFDRETLGLSTEGNRVGAWPIKYCRVSRTGTGSFLLSIDGEKVVFAPDEADAFSLAAAQHFHASSLADRIDVIRGTGGRHQADLHTAVRRAPDGEETERPRIAIDWRLMATLVTVAVVAIAVGLITLARTGDDSTGVEPGASPVTTTTVEPALPALFEQRPAEFVAAWNAAASELGVEALIREQLNVGTFETDLAPYVSLLGTTDESDDSIASVVVVVDPSGDTEDDELALAVLGVAITVADPDATGSQRRAVLERLGLDVDRPDLTGLDGEAVYPGVRYTIQYFPEFSSLLFSMMAP